MKSDHAPRDLPPMTAEAARQLQLWEQLREQMQKLHAELEYTRLMLKLEVNNGK